MIDVTFADLVEIYRATRFDDENGDVLTIKNDHMVEVLTAIMESDTHEQAGLIKHLDTDDVVGRVTIRLGALFERTVYDCWYSLGRHDYKDYIPGGGGPSMPSEQSVRLRYSVSFRSMRTRMLGYLDAPLHGTPLHEIAFDNQTRSLSLIKGAKYGARPPHRPSILTAAPAPPPRRNASLRATRPIRAKELS